MSVAAAVQRYRLWEKQPPPAAYVGAAAAAHAAQAAAVAAVALAAENRTELASLAPDLQRQNVHFTHVRTWSATDMQPGDLTRESFWKHLETVYLEAYREAANESGSILMLCCLFSCLVGCLVGYLIDCLVGCLVRLHGC